MIGYVPSPSRSLASKLAAAALVIVSVSHSTAAVAAEPQAAAPPSAEAVKRATDEFLRAQKLFDGGKFSEALSGFTASYEAVASPNSNLYIARCQAALGDLKKAWYTFTRVIVEATERAPKEPKYAPTLKTATAERREVEQKLGLLTVIVNGRDDAALEIAGQPVGPREWGVPRPVDPGDIEVVVTPSGREPIRKSIEVKAGERRELTIDTTPAAAPSATNAEPSEGPSPPPGPLRPYAYVVGGVGLAGLMVGAVSGIMFNSHLSHLETECNPICPRTVEDDLQAARTSKTVANVGFAIGAVGLGVGAALFVMSQPKTRTNSGAIPVRVVLSPTSARFEGRF